MSKIFSILLFFLLSFSLFKAQEIVTTEEDLDPNFLEKINNLVPTDSLMKTNPVVEAQHYPKRFEKGFESKYTDEEFDYHQHKVEESVWSKIKRKILEWLSDLFGQPDPRKTSDSLMGLFKVISIVLILVVGFFILKFIMSKEGNFFFSKKNKSVAVNESDVVENIHEINFPSMIKSYEDSSDYRSSIRYHFLYLLKNLTDRGILDWNPEKTNKDYIQEIKKEEIKKEFDQLVYIYDNVWYGEFEVDGENYKTIKERFLNFKNRI